MPDALLKSALLQLPTQILNDLAEGKSPESLGRAICQFAERVAPGRIATIMSVRPEGTLSVYAAPSAAPELIAALNGLQPGPRSGSCGTAVYSHQPTLVSHVAHDPRWDDLRSVAQDWNLQSCWSYPVWLDERIAGTFALTGQSTGMPDADALELLEFCAAMTGTVLRYAQMQARAQSQHESLARALQFNAMLAQVNQVIAGAMEAHDLFKAICEIAVQYGGLKLAFIAVPDADRRFKVLASAGDTGYLEDLYISTDPDIPEGQGSMGRAWRDGQMRYNQSFVNAPHLAPWRAQAERFGFGASAALPILRQGAVKAILSVYHHEEYVFDRELQRLLEELSHSVSRGLEHIFLQRRLTHEQDKQRYLTIHDVLTGLPNRLALDQHLPGALARARKDQTLLAVCMADIDDFKAINERCGETAGDQVLKTVAQRLRSALRDTDLVARSGGDEFVLVVEGLLRYEDLFPRLERIREGLTSPITLPGCDPVIPQLSLGLTFYPNDGSDAGLLLRHAFEAMNGLKAHKRDRTNWWQIWGEGNLTATASLPHSVPPYGAEAAALLIPLQDSLAPLGEEFVARFQSEWASRPDIARILERLNEGETEALKARLQRHILMLQRPDLTEAEHRSFAEDMGRVNTLVGFELTALIDGIQAYEGQLRRRLFELQGMRLSEKQLVADLMAMRLRVELESHIHALQQLLVERQSWLARQSLRLSQATSWVDACRGFLEDVTALQGCVAATINRPDPSGKLAYEFKTAVLERYLNDLATQGVVPHLADAEGVALPAAHLRVWQSEQIETNASYGTDPHLAHLRDMALQSGIHSAIFVPITDSQGRVTAALGIFGHHPGQFESAETRLFFQALGYLLSQARQRLYRPNLVSQSADQRRAYRTLLENDRLVLEYQPIVDLTTGNPAKIEALARLRAEDGTLVRPITFLPGFGTRELVLLFQLGLDQALSQLGLCLEHHPELIVSLNLPPAVLIEAGCAQWVEQALRRHHIAPQRLELEVLEDEEFHDLETARTTLQTLDGLGVRLVMDDLGAGYSSLLRLRSLPFGTVKIDQGLVREIARDPERVIDFISGLVRLAKSLKLRVIVEGLESAELVEVASLLGADEGQGYALAMPLPAEALADWLANFHWVVPHDNPVTPLGLLALQKRGY